MSRFPSILIVLIASETLCAQSDIQFNRDIRPILADSCFTCHGPDAHARKAKLRLDTRDGMLAEGKRGRAVVPGKPDESLLIARIFHRTEKKRMPPAKSGKSLTETQRAQLRQWIENGAPWQDHWSFEPLRRPTAPAAAHIDARFRGTPIDRFLDAHLRKIKIEPAHPAEPRTLIRRLYFDLTGLPPEPETVESFADNPQSYERIVDRLLASDAHAERLTMYWLDLVRYADTCGIHGDQPIPMSPFRDWVIRAFRENKPFDAFTRDQLAGDLLPDAGVQEKVASGYNRLNMKTAEGGAQEEEYLAKYAADRVRTTATTWLGATLGCAQCHDHKFDPYTTKDFYRFAAFFADLDHKGFYGGANSTGDWGPKIEMPTPEQQVTLTKIDATIAGLERQLQQTTPEIAAAQREWEALAREEMARNQSPTFGPWRSIGPFRGKNLRAAHDRVFGPELDASSDRVHGALRWRPRPEWLDRRTHKLTGPNSATYLFRVVESPSAQRLRLSIGSDDSLRLWVNGEAVLDRYVSRGVRPGDETPTIALRKGHNELLMKVCNGGGGYGFYFAAMRPGPPAPFDAIVKLPDAQRSADQRTRLAAYYRSITSLLAHQKKQLEAARKRRSDLEKDIPTTLVSKVRAKPRVTRVLPRGNWLDKTGEVVTPGVPAFLPQPRANADAESDRLTRLDLANWITSKENPLTARVFANRMWKLFFGRGLSATLDDAGSQGAWPQQLELLDWLAADFREDWNVRRLIKQIVMSEAYRMSSDSSPESLRRDPENLTFARQGRFRLDAEMIRDQALAVSGLLVRKVGGPSVKPYQPAGHWAQLNFPRRTWKNDVGPDQYRRGLYTHWQRTFLHPSMRAFDAPTREECTAERPRSNTPLQALALLNDPSYVEAARAFALRILRADAETFPRRLTLAFRDHLGRKPSKNEIETLSALWNHEHKRYAKNPGAARELTTVGQNPTPEGTNLVDLAAWTAITRVLFNLHEAITRY